MGLVMRETRKRKSPEEENSIPAFSMEELNQDLLERVLSWLPASNFFRARSVCKRWTSIQSSATFQMACSEIPFREPWYLMVGQELDRSIVFDTSEMKWKNLNHPILLQQSHCSNSIPVASSVGLVCFRTPSSDFIICNPVTGACRELPPSNPLHTLRAIAMNSSDSKSYRIILVSGESSNLTIKTFDSKTSRWGEEVMLHTESNNPPESHETGHEAVYFLSKSGAVVSANTQRSPSKQYSSVLTVENGEEVVHFLSQSGTVVSCNLAQKTFFEHPGLLPIYFEYSIDVVECKGEMLVVLLWEFLETASVRVWKFSKSLRSWIQVAVMPPSMSNEYYGKKADINCAGRENAIFICVNSSNFSSYIMCNLVSNEWLQLPKYYVNGRAKEFMSALAFEPRVEASV